MGVLLGEAEDKKRSAGDGTFVEFLAEPPFPTLPTTPDRDWMLLPIFPVLCPLPVDAVASRTSSPAQLALQSDSQNARRDSCLSRTEEGT